MIFLTLRTDKPESELAVFSDETKVTEISWQAHRQLAETIHTKIDEIAAIANVSMNQIEGIVCFKGPGSFTGLRIGLSVANTIAAIHGTPIVAEGGTEWRQNGIGRLLLGENDRLALPEYGAPATTTIPKK